MQTKRALSPGGDVEPRHNDGLPTSKRLRVVEPNRAHALRRDILSTLSDELLVRILSYLDERTLLEASQVSWRLHRITGDSQLWRSHYYKRFILPRAHRIPGFKSGISRSSSKLHYSAQKSVWADGGWGRRGGLVESTSTYDSHASSVDWKKQYRLRHNWAQGRCAVDEVKVHDMERSLASATSTTTASPDTESQTLVKVVEGLVVMADDREGLRAWDLKTRDPVVQMQIQLAAGQPIKRPSCLAIDDQRLGDDIADISVGFRDGTFGIWRLDLRRKSLVLLYRHGNGLCGVIEAIAYRHPYILTASQLGFISLYTFDYTPPGRDWGIGSDIQTGNANTTTKSTTPLSQDPRPANATVDEERVLHPPYLLTSLKSHNTRPPLALSIRNMASSVVASVSYVFDAVGGWSIGIQDFDIKKSLISSKPDVAASRLAYTLPTLTRGSLSSTPGSSPIRGQNSRNAYVPESDGPTRLCYSHPYLLATLPDNTLVLHVCKSTASSLSISPGVRLWGHTSGISDAEITPRGKAVSVSKHGDEIRIWELEGYVGGASVEVRPRQHQNTSMAAGSSEGQQRAPPLQSVQTESEPGSRNQVSFDEETVIVLKEAKNGGQSLMVYDFT